MARRGSALLGVLVVVVIAALAWWLLREGGDGDSGPALVRADRAAQGVEQPTRLPPHPAMNSGGPSPALVDALGGVVTTPVEAIPGRAALLIDLRRAEDDAPIAGARLRIHAWRDRAANAMVNQFVRTGADGTARLEFPHAVEIQEIEAPPGNDHGYVLEKPALLIERGEARHLLLHPRVGAVVRGRVVDEQKVPVAGAGVLAWADHHLNLNSGEGPLPPPDLTAGCDAGGRFELRGVGPELALMPEVAGLAAIEGAMVELSDLSGEPRADGELIEDVTLVVGAGVVLQGRVVDPAGQPVPEVWVGAGYVSYSSAGSRVGPMRPLRSGARTDGGGGFRIGPIARKSWWVGVGDDRFRPWGKQLTPDGSELLIRLETACSFSGMVYGADGAPLDGAVVTLQGASQDANTADGGGATMRTEAGRFAFGSLLPTKTAALGVSVEGHAIHVIEPLVVSEQAGAPIEVRLQAESPIAGRVVDEHDQPVVAARVTVRGDRVLTNWPWTDRSWEEFVFPRTGYTTSDAEGRFRIDRLYDGEFALTVADSRSPDLEARLTVRSGVEDLLVRLDPAALRRAVVHGTVRDGTTGAPVTKFEIMIVPDDPERIRSGMPVKDWDFDDAGGAFVIEGFEPGRWALFANAAGYAQAAVHGLELRDGEQSVDVALLPARTLHLRLVDQDREPVPNAYLHFEDGSGQRIELREQPLGKNSIGMTDSGGEVTAKGLPAGQITLVVKVPLAPDPAVGTHVVRLPVDLRAPLEGVQEFVVERPNVRCLVLGLAETDEPPPVTIFDTDDEAAEEALRPLAESEALKSIERPIVVTVRDAEGAVVDTARCAPNPAVPGGWIVSSSVCSSDGEPTSWLAAALPASTSTVQIAAEGYEPVTLTLPAGEGHLKRYVILRRAQ